MTTTYVLHTNEEVIMVLLDLEKAYYLVFSLKSDAYYEFGTHMSRLIFLFDQNATSHVILNSRGT